MRRKKAIATRLPITALTVTLITLWSEGMRRKKAIATSLWLLHELLRQLPSRKECAARRRLRP